MAKRLIPSLNRILVEKIVPPSKTSSGILLPEKTTKLNSGKVVAVGPGARDRDGKLIPVSLKEGDTVLLPEYGGMEVKLGDKEKDLKMFSSTPHGVDEISITPMARLSTDLRRFHLFRDDDILGTLHD